MATCVSDSWLVSSLSESNSFLGATNHSDNGCVILTDVQTTTVYKVSDQHHTVSFTLKSDAKFRLPVVFDFEEKKFVAVVDQLNKKRLCIWEEDCLDYKDWKKKQLLDDIKAIVEVDGSEPLVVKTDGTVSWLSQLDEPAVRIQLVPENFNKDDVTLRKFRAYREGTKTELIYHIDVEGKSLAYQLQFISKQVAGLPTALFDQLNMEAVCKCVRKENPTFIAANAETHTLVVSSSGEELVELHNLSDKLSVLSLSFLQDNDQLLISANNASENIGQLMIFSIKFGTVRVIKTLDSRLCGELPVTHVSSYLLTHSQTAVHAHAYKFHRVTLRSMLGSTNPSASTAVTQNDVDSCMDTLDKLAKKSELKSASLNNYGKSTLLDTLQAYCKVDCTRWKSAVIVKLLESLVVPSHILIQVAEGVLRHDDSHTAEYLTYQVPELSEAAVITLLDFFLRKLPEEEDDDNAMKIDEVVHERLSIADPTAMSTIDTLLGREITDVYASEAMKKLDFSRVTVLLRHISNILSNDGESKHCFNDELIGRWCAVILDAHYTQIILSEHAQLLVELHENIRQQVELYSNMVKLGANLAYKPPVMQPSQGPYCIEAVTFRY